MDRRSTPFSGRVAHTSLKGVVEAEVYSDGRPARISVPLTYILRAPNEAKDRQLLWGDLITVLDARDGYAYVISAKDGYCGWVIETAIGPDYPATHRVKTAFAQIYPEPRVSAPEIVTIPFGAQVQVLGGDEKFLETTQGFIPTTNLRLLDDHDTDPVEVAARFLGTPYLWAGNSRAGIDCSGLAQTVMLACGIPCPGDSDQQTQMGRAVGHNEKLEAGDLVFWKGHVAVVSGEDEIIHATGAFMQVVREPLSQAESRIREQGNGDITHRRRPRG